MSWQELLVTAMTQMNARFMSVVVVLIIMLGLGPFLWRLARNWRRETDQVHQIKLLEEQAKRHQGKFLEAKPERQSERNRQEDY